MMGIFACILLLLHDIQMTLFYFYSLHPQRSVYLFFFLTNPAPPKISPLPLHDALPIYTLLMSTESRPSSQKSPTPKPRAEETALIPDPAVADTSVKVPLPLYQQRRDPGLTRFPQHEIGRAHV